MTKTDGRSAGEVFVAGADLAEEVGIGFSNSYRLRREKAGLFPPRMHLTKVVVYLRGEIALHNALHVAARDGHMGAFLARCERELDELPRWLINLAALLEKRNPAALTGDLQRYNAQA